MPPRGSTTFGMCISYFVFLGRGGKGGDEERITDLEKQAGIPSSSMRARRTPRWTKQRRTRFPTVPVR